MIFDIDWQGARQLAENAPDDTVRVFILPPSRRALEERLRTRAADPPEVVARRLAGAAAEMSHWDEYDYVIVNDDLAESLASLRAILVAERLKRARHPGSPILSAACSARTISRQSRSWTEAAAAICAGDDF